MCGGGGGERGGHADLPQTLEGGAREAQVFWDPRWRLCVPKAGCFVTVRLGPGFPRVI